MLAGHPVEEESAATQGLLVVAGLLLGRVIVPAVANLSSEPLLGHLDVEVPLVQDSSDVVEVPLAHDLHVMLKDRSIVLVGVPEALVIPHAFLVELIVREPHFYLNSDEERQLQALLPLIDGKQGLLVIDVVLVFGFIVQGYLHRCSL